MMLRGADQRRLDYDGLGVSDGIGLHCKSEAQRLPVFQTVSPSVKKCASCVTFLQSVGQVFDSWWSENVNDYVLVSYVLLQHPRHQRVAAEKSTLLYTRHLTQGTIVVHKNCTYFKWPLKYPDQFVIASDKDYYAAAALYGFPQFMHIFIAL